MATVGQLIAETLAAHQIDRVFCVPGESYLGLLDALLRPQWHRHRRVPGTKAAPASWPWPMRC